MTSLPNILIRNFPHLEAVEHLMPTQFEIPQTERPFPVFLLESGTKIVYKGSTGRNREIATVKTNKKIPTSFPVYYFEISVEEIGTGGTIAIGVGPSTNSFSKMIGVERGYGFSLEDGRKYSDSSRGVPYATSFSKGDIAGICVNLVNKTIFLTKNGTAFGEAFKNIKTDDLFPSVTIHSLGASVLANFGENPFAFHFEEYSLELIKSIRQEIYKDEPEYEDQLDEKSVLGLIFNYMEYHSYSESALELSRTTGIPLTKSIEELRLQKEIYDYVKSENYEKVFNILSERYPYIEQRFPRVYLILLCLMFLQLLKSACNTSPVAASDVGVKCCASSNNSKAALNSNEVIRYDSNEILERIVFLGRQIHFIYSKSLEFNHGNLNPYFLDECGLTNAQWNVYIRELLCLMAYSDIKIFQEHEKHINLKPRLICGLAYALHDNHETCLLDICHRDTFITLDRGFIQNDINSSLTLAYFVRHLENDREQPI